jgi:Ca2+-binding RTX toxin-like protein
LLPAADREIVPSSFLRKVDAMMERLECRKLMSVSAYTTGWTLVVDGDSANNWISVERSSGVLWVKLYGSGGGQSVYHVSDDSVDEIQLRGGSGNDILTVSHSITDSVTIWGGAGEDYIVGGGGYNSLAGHGFGTGSYSGSNDDGSDDILVSGSGDSELWGQDGNDEFYTDNYAVSGLDFLFGGDGDDSFYIRGKDHNAYALGEAGNDRLIPSQSATQHVQFDGGAGWDYVNYRAWTQAVYVRPNGLNDSGLRYGTRRQQIGDDVEYIDGTDYDDHFSGTNNANTFYGYGGNDLIYGYSGNDVLLGHDGNDTIYAGGGDDFVYGGNDDDTLFGDAGNDTVYGTDGNDYLRGGDGNDQLYGENDSDNIYGDAGNDLLVGGSGSDFLVAHDGVFGNDTIFGDEINGTHSSGWWDVAYVDRFNYLTDLCIGVETITF